MMAKAKIPSAMATSTRVKPRSPNNRMTFRLRLCDWDAEGVAFTFREMISGELILVDRENYYKYSVIGNRGFNVFKF
jgi:hypothetical protein